MSPVLNGFFKNLQPLVDLPVGNQSDAIKKMGRFADKFGAAALTEFGDLFDMLFSILNLTVKNPAL